ncbi:MAG TPA: hypothetical protein VGJ81_18695 [Thermoanaerobaculia bacterium]
MDRFQAARAYVNRAAFASLLAGFGLLDPAETDDKRIIVAWNDSHALLMHDAHFSYQAILRADGDRYDITSESLYDVADKRGRNDVAASHRADVERFRRAGQAYVDTYGWLVASGHSGVPPR